MQSIPDLCKHRSQGRSVYCHTADVMDYIQKGKNMFISANGGFKSKVQRVDDGAERSRRAQDNQISGVSPSR